MDFSQLWTILYFLYNFVSDLYIYVPRLTWHSSKLGLDYQYFNILFSCTDDPDPLIFRTTNERTYLKRTNARTTTYPKAWLDLHDSRFVLPFESLHLGRFTTFSWLFKQKKTPYIMIYAPLPPSPNEAKYIFIHVSSQHLSSLKKSHKTSLLSSCWFGSMKQRGPPVYVYRFIVM